MDSCYLSLIKNVCFVIAGIIVSYSLIAQPPATYSSFNPVTPWLDNHNVHINAHGGGVLFFDNKYYWFGEHKVEGEIGNTAQVGFHCYSSADLYNWFDEGIALAVSNDSTSEIYKGSIMERPKVIYNPRTKKFVMWFHLELFGKVYTSARSGVAVSDHITGHYKFVKSYRPNAGQWPVNVLPLHKAPVPEAARRNFCGGKECLPDPDAVNILGRDFKQGQMARDMTLFVDDDGKAYHIFASEENSTLHISQLSEDYLSYAGPYVRAFVGRYMEAPAIFKRNKKYYFIGSDCTGWKPNAARSAVADSIFGEWKELGNPCDGEDAELTFRSQSTYVLPVAGRKDAFIFMADRWNPDNPIDGRYVWLPIKFDRDKFRIEWKERWDLSVFK